MSPPSSIDERRVLVGAPDIHISTGGRPGLHDGHMTYILSDANISVTTESVLVRPSEQDGGHDPVRPLADRIVEKIDAVIVTLTVWVGPAYQQVGHPLLIPTQGSLVEDTALVDRVMQAHARSCNDQASGNSFVAEESCLCTRSRPLP